MPAASAMQTIAIVPAAGQGRRMGADKALLPLGGLAAVERLAQQCLAAGVDAVVVVRARGAQPLPPLPAAVQVVEVPGDGEMIDSLRAGLQACPTATTAVVCPVDHALVAADTIAALLHGCSRPGKAIALPLFGGRPGHPIALAGAALAELRQGAAPTLRDVVRADPARVIALPSANPWVLADLDRPDDLRCAQAALAAQPLPTLELMHRHRSRRRYAPTPLADGQLERLVDAARHASTSSFIQAYAVVAVADPARKARCAELCGDQQHIAEAPLFLAICADLHKLDQACRQHGSTLQAQSFELFLQAAIDAALLGQNLQLAAEAEGLGSCMIGAARNHPRELAALLQLPPGAFVVFGMTLGHATDDPLPRDRMPLDGVLHRELYDAARTAAVLAATDELQRDWARRVNAGGHGRPVDPHKGWSDRMAATWGTGSRHLRERAGLRSELNGLGFGLE